MEKPTALPCTHLHVNAIDTVSERMHRYQNEHAFDYSLIRYLNPSKLNAMFSRRGLFFQIGECANRSFIPPRFRPRCNLISTSSDRRGYLAMLNDSPLKISKANALFVVLLVACKVTRTYVCNIYQREQPPVNRGFIHLNDDRSNGSYDAYCVLSRVRIRAPDNTSLHFGRSSRATSESISRRDIAL